MTDTASRTLKLASWNVNGLRAVLKKDPSFTDIVAELDADILGLQETKLQEGQVELDLPGYHPVSYTHLTLPTKLEWCRSRWSPYH